jgi:hypothetical protein
MGILMLKKNGGVAVVSADDAVYDNDDGDAAMGCLL